MCNEANTMQSEYSRPRMLSTLARTLAALAVTLACLGHAAPVNAQSTWLTPNLTHEAGMHPGLAVIDETVIGMGLITAWGVWRWDWFERDFHFKNEHGFSRRSSTGGADKTGHFILGYLTSDIFAWRLRTEGYSRAAAYTWGALGSILVNLWLEVGDGTSDYGFSNEDLVADVLGASASLLLGVCQPCDDLIDIRIQYWPTSNYVKSGSLVGDYSGMKHLAAFKLSGVPYVKQTPLRYLEAHVGFYSRGFRSFDDEDDPRRVVYGAVAINLAELFHPIAPEALVTAFEYYQFPYVAAEVVTKTYR